MGKPTIEQCEGLINHFSHQHPLQLHNNSTLQALSYATCSGCHEEASGSMYTCRICSYYLHKKCSEMPQKITHPCDQEHVLCLLEKPKYPEGIFNCDACGKKGGGFCYCCEACGTDLHISCASLPIHFNHQCHIHQLTLTFSPAYPKKSFHCGLCQCLGSNVWFYRCSSCEFDVHLSCVSAMRKNKLQSATPTMTNYMNPMSQQMGQMSIGQLNNQGAAMGMPFNTPKQQMMNSNLAQNNLMMNHTMPQNNMMMNHTMPQNNMMMNSNGNQAMAQQVYAQQQALAQQALMQQQAMAQKQCNVQQQMMTQQQLMAQQQMMVQQQMMAQQQQQQPGNMIMSSLVGGMANGVATAATEALFQGLMGQGGGGGMMADSTDYGGGVDSSGGGDYTN